MRLCQPVMFSWVTFAFPLHSYVTKERVPTLLDMENQETGYFMKNMFLLSSKHCGFQPHCSSVWRGFTSCNIHPTPLHKSPAHKMSLKGQWKRMRGESRRKRSDICKWPKGWDGIKLEEVKWCERETHHVCHRPPPSTEMTHPDT